MVAMDKTTGPEKTYLAVVPEGLLASGSSLSSGPSTSNDLNHVPFLRLPHPRTSKPNLYLPYPSSAASASKSDAELKGAKDEEGTIFEVQVVDPSSSRSWFLTDPRDLEAKSVEGPGKESPTGIGVERIIADGTLLLFTPIDPLFLLIPLLVGTLPHVSSSSSVSYNTASALGSTSTAATSRFERALSDPKRRGNYLPLDDLIESMSKLPAYTSDLEPPFTVKPRPTGRTKGLNGNGIGPSIDGGHGGDGSNGASSRRGLKRDAVSAGLDADRNQRTAEEMDEEEASRMDVDGGKDDPSAGGRPALDDEEKAAIDPADFGDSARVSYDLNGGTRNGTDEGQMGNLDVVRFCAIEGVRRYLIACCETQVLPSYDTSTTSPPSASQTFYRPSPPAILAHLRRKIDRLACREIIDRSEGLMRGLAVGGVGVEVMSAGNPKEATLPDEADSGAEDRIERSAAEEVRLAGLRLVADQARRKVGCELVGGYLPGEVSSTLVGSYDFSALTEHLEAQANLSFASSHIATVSNPSDANTLIGDSGIKKKPVVVASQGSRGVKALEKVNTSKMPKLTSFFTKKPPAAVKK